MKAEDVASIGEETFCHLLNLIKSLLDLDVPCFYTDDCVFIAQAAQNLSPERVHELRVISIFAEFARRYTGDNEQFVKQLLATFSSYRAEPTESTRADFIAMDTVSLLCTYVHMCEEGSFGDTDEIARRCLDVFARLTRFLDTKAAVLHLGQAVQTVMLPAFTHRVADLEVSSCCELFTSLAEVPELKQRLLSSDTVSLLTTSLNEATEAESQDPADEVATTAKHRINTLLRLLKKRGRSTDHAALSPVRTRRSTQQRLQ